HDQPEQPLDCRRCLSRSILLRLRLWCSSACWNTRRWPRRRVDLSQELALVVQLYQIYGTGEVLLTVVLDGIPEIEAIRDILLACLNCNRVGFVQWSRTPIVTCRVAVVRPQPVDSRNLIQGKRVVDGHR